MNAVNHNVPAPNQAFVLLAKGWPVIHGHVKSDMSTVQCTLLPIVKWTQEHWTSLFLHKKHAAIIYDCVDKQFEVNNICCLLKLQIFRCIFLLLLTCLIFFFLVKNHFNSVVKGWMICIGCMFILVCIIVPKV